MIRRLAALFVAGLVFCSSVSAAEADENRGESRGENRGGDGHEAQGLHHLPGLSGLPGAVLSIEPMQVTASISAVGIAKRIRYLSTDPSGRLIVVSGVVVSPKPSVLFAHPEGARKIVAWAHGTSGIADNCAPSRQTNLDTVETGDGMYAHTVASYVAQGWTVTATDYPGLGTPGASPYLIGNSEGRAVIDSVRAARFLNPFLSNDWVVSGHSQGGQAALFASELAPTYGHGLDLKGTVAIAPVSHLELWTPALVGSPVNALVVWTIYGLAALDPSVVPEQILAPEVLSQTEVLATGCVNEAGPAFGVLTPAQTLIGGTLPPAILSKLAANNPGGRPNGSPVLFVQGDFDFVVPLPLTQSLYAQECSTNSQPLKLEVYPGSDHGSVVTNSSASVLAYIAARFAGAPAPSTCP